MKNVTLSIRLLFLLSAAFTTGLPLAAQGLVLIAAQYSQFVHPDLAESSFEFPSRRTRAHLGVPHQTW
jgi:hypothetical protein